METPGLDPAAPYEVGWGWLRGTFRDADPYQVARLTDPGTEVEPSHGTRHYGRSMSIGRAGAMIAWSPRRHGAGRDGEVLLDIPQAALDALGWREGSRLSKRLAQAGIRYSRVDAWVNDRRRVVEPQAVLHAFRSRQCIAHTRHSQLVDDSEGGATCYIGSRSSELFLRVYDKERQSGEAGAGIRWELEAKDERAHPVAQRWADASAPAAELFGMIRGLVDFRDRTLGDHGDRAPMLPWWETLTAGAGRTTLATPRRQDSIAKTREWLEGQVARPLALVVEVMGREYLEHLLALGRERMTPRDWRQVGDR